MDIEALINSIYVRNPLWDQKDSQHHNRFVLDKLWGDVANEMNSTRNIVRTKWKNLRDSFRKHVRKIPVKDGTSSLTPSWSHFDSLYFLKDQFIAQASTESLPDAEDGNVLDEDTKSQLSETNSQHMDNSSSFDVSPLATSDLSLSISTSKKCKCKRKQTDSEGDATHLRLEEEKLHILEKQHKKLTDEDESFFRSILPHIRQLTPQRKMLFRIKMQELVYNFVYGQNEYEATQSTSSASNLHAYETDTSQLVQVQPLPHDYSDST